MTLSNLCFFYGSEMLRDVCQSPGSIWEAGGKCWRASPTTQPSLALPCKAYHIKNIFNKFTVHFVSASFCLLALVKRIWIGNSAKHFQRIWSQSHCHQIETQHHPNFWVSCSHMILTSKGISCSNYKQISLNFTEIDNNGNKISLFHDEHYQ